MLTFVSLFSGIGGIDLGLERAGMHCVAQVEKDDYCQRVLKKHWPDVEKFGDIRDVGINRKHELPAADLVCGGFPCQPHSTAGKRRGAADDRNLWPEYRRIIGEGNYRWVIAENVLGIRTTILDQVLSDLEGLDYTAIPFVIPACAFNAPHIRRRIFIIAHANGYDGRLPVPAKEQEEGLFTGRAGKEGVVTDTTGPGPQKRKIQRQNKAEGRPTEPYSMGQTGKANYWRTEPGVCGMVDGVPDRVDRVRALGNAVVPQVAEWFGEMILSVEKNIMVSSILRK